MIGGMMHYGILNTGHYDYEGEFLENIIHGKGV